MKLFGKVSLLIFALSLAAVGVSAQQATKKTNMNDLPYAKVKAMFSNPESAAKTVKMAKENGVMLMGGVPIKGKPVTMKGEITGGDCYLSQGMHGHEHAFCAKACVVHGGPVVFIANSGEVYLVLLPKDGTPIIEQALDDLGKPGVTVKGNLVDAHGLKAISIDSVQG
jgi:hypothetical protein